VLTTAYLGRPDLFEHKPRATAVVTAGPGQGRITLEAGGREVDVLMDVDLDEFYRYILGQWAR
jgi:purine nucleosidase